MIQLSITQADGTQLEVDAQGLAITFPDRSNPHKGASFAISQLGGERLRINGLDGILVQTFAGPAAINLGTARK